MGKSCLNTSNLIEACSHLYNAGSNSTFRKKREIQEKRNWSLKINEIFLFHNNCSCNQVSLAFVLSEGGDGDDDHSHSL